MASKLTHKEVAAALGLFIGSALAGMAAGASATPSCEGDTSYLLVTSVSIDGALQAVEAVPAGLVADNPKFSSTDIDGARARLYDPVSRQLRDVFFARGVR